MMKNVLSQYFEEIPKSDLNEITFNLPEPLKGFETDEIYYPKDTEIMEETPNDGRSTSGLSSEELAFGSRNPTGQNCDICFVFIETDEELRSHMNLHEASDVLMFIPCSICLKPFQCEETLQWHMKKYHPKEYEEPVDEKSRIKCDRCDKTFKNDNALITHMEEHNDLTSEKAVQERTFVEKVFTCEICQKVYKRFSALWKHMKVCDSNEKIELDCKLCSKVFKTKNAFLLHKVVTHAGEKKLEINFSLKRQSSQQNLTVHKRSYTNDLKSDKLEHKDDEKPLSCEIVANKQEYKGNEKPLLFDTVADKQEHKEKPLPCDICQRVLKTKLSLSRHMKNCHDPNKKTDLSCQYCPKVCKTSYSLTSHERVHTGERPFKCSLCPQSLKSKPSLKIHERSHTNEKPFICKFCDKGFNQFPNLTRHIQIHENKRRFTCQHCQKKFRLKQSLEQHMNGHTGKRPYKCRFCSKTFSQKASMYVHERNTHDELKTMFCVKCSKSFGIRYLFKNHKCDSRKSVKQGKRKVRIRKILDVPEDKVEEETITPEEIDEEIVVYVGQPIEDNPNEMVKTDLKLQAIIEPIRNINKNDEVGRIEKAVKVKKQKKLEKFGKRKLTVEDKARIKEEKKAEKERRMKEEKLRVKLSIEERKKKEAVLRAEAKLRTKLNLEANFKKVEKRAKIKKQEIEERKKRKAEEKEKRMEEKLKIHVALAKHALIEEQRKKKKAEEFAKIQLQNKKRIEEKSKIQFLVEEETKKAKSKETMKAKDRDGGNKKFMITFNFEDITEENFGNIIEPIEKINENAENAVVQELQVKRQDFMKRKFEEKEVIVVGTETVKVNNSEDFVSDKKPKLEVLDDFQLEPNNDQQILLRNFLVEPELELELGRPNFV